MGDLQQTQYIQTSNPAYRADFNKEGFDRLISEKGRDVLIERALECPCKGAATNQLSNCKNCGGSGFIFINGRQTRMIMSGIDVSTKYAPWSEEARGTVGITAMMEEDLCYLDRITDINGKAVFNEVLTFRQFNGNVFAYAAYQVKEILYAGVFVNESTKLTKLTDRDYSIDGNIIYLNDTVANRETASVTVRYQHSPAFHIIEFKRETIQSFKLPSEGEEILQHLPISAFGKRAHYQMADKKRTSGVWLLNNDYNEQVIDCNTLSPLITYNFILHTSRTFDYTINIIEAANYATQTTDRSYLFIVKNVLDQIIINLSINNGITILTNNMIRLLINDTSGFALGDYTYVLKEIAPNLDNIILNGTFTIIR